MRLARPLGVAYELLCADHLVIRGHPFLAWHEGRDLRFSIYGFEPWPKNLPPDILTGPYWRFDPAFEISLWKPFACSLLLPASVSCCGCEDAFHDRHAVSKFSRRTGERHNQPLLWTGPRRE